MGILGEPSMKLSSKIKNITFAFVINVVWVLILMSFLRNLNTADLLMQVDEPEFVFFMACIWAPIWEEVAFRWFPITIANKFDKKFGMGLLWPLVIVSSLIFGWGHGNENWPAPIAILVQGVGGLIMSILYIKNNNSLVSSMVLHSMWNTLVIFII